MLQVGGENSFTFYLRNKLVFGRKKLVLVVSFVMSQSKRRWYNFLENFRKSYERFFL